jgi:hypothetical protein
MTKWNDASLTKPPPGEEVWVYCNFVMVGPPNWNVATAYYSDGIWREGDGDECEVTHWMPMNKPQAPKES